MIPNVDSRLWLLPLPTQIPPRSPRWVQGKPQLQIYGGVRYLLGSATFVMPNGRTVYRSVYHSAPTETPNQVFAKTEALIQDLPHPTWNDQMVSAP